jgi:LPS-assembly protein
MTHSTLALTCTVLAASLFGPAPVLAADGVGIFDQRCYSDVPAAQSTPANINQLPVEVNADSAEATQDGKAIYRGDVQIFQGIRTLSSRYTELDQVTRDLTAKGNVFYQDGQVTLRSNDALHSNLDTRETRLDKAEYQLHSSPARGKAEQITLNEQQRQLELKTAQFTTCPPGQEMWWLKASSVKIDQSEVFGEAWNATLWLYDVPVFYVPYMTFPVKDERKSGLLYPTFGFSSSNGIDLRTPYYWNIAPNYDMTLTPRYIENRGTMLQNEFRYMPTQEQNGKLYTEYMGEDRRAKASGANVDSRWLVNLNHQSRLYDDSLRIKADVTRVGKSDYNYFNDLSPPVSSGVDNQLMQSLAGGFYQEQWNVSGEVRDYQILLPDALQPHKMLPRLNYNAYQTGSWYESSFSSELTRFTHSSDLHKSYTGTRFHAEPEITIPLATAAGYSLESQFKLMYSHYEQELPEDLDSYYRQQGFGNLASSVNRTLPSARVKGGMVFDRMGNWNNQLYTQTLEPEVQYHYVPYQNQDNIGLFDTTNILPDYYSLFSDQRFAGLDRISDANNVSLGLTSRVFDDQSVERVRVTVGQAYSLTKPRVTLLPNETQSTNSRSLLTFEGDVHPSDPWFLKARMLYNTEAKNVSHGSSAVEYRQNDFMGQLNYRYVREGNIVVSSPYEQTDMSQVGALTAIPINKKWQAIAAYYYDLQQNLNIDRLVGLRYDSCCWSLDLVLEQENKPDNVTLTAEPETRFGLQFQMKGLGSVGSGTNYTLNTQLLPYTRPFNLND